MYNYFVNENATGDANGVDWYNGFTDISGALNIIDTIPEDSGVNIFLAAGNYYADINRSQANFYMGGGYIVPSTVTSGNMYTNYPRFITRIVSNENHLNSGNFFFDGIEYMSYDSGYLFYSVTNLTFDNCEIFATNGIKSLTTSGVLYADELRAIGNGSGAFFNGGYIGNISNSVFSKYDDCLGFYFINDEINTSVIHHCNRGLVHMFEAGEPH